MNSKQRQQARTRTARAFPIGSPVRVEHVKGRPVFCTVTGYRHDGARVNLKMRNGHQRSERTTDCQDALAPYGLSKAQQ